MSKNRSIGTIYRKLVANPFFPMLFIGEFVKTAVMSGFDLGLALLAVISTIMWALSDDAKEMVEEVTDDG